MYKQKKIVAIIPARGGSKRVPRKNIRMIQGKPLIAYTIERALSCGVFDKVVVSTEDPAIAKIAQKYGAEVPFLRPKKLATDTAVGWKVLQHVITALKKECDYVPDFAVSLSVCSPLRNTHDIKKCVDTFINKKADFVRSAVKAQGNPYFNMVEVINGTVSLVKKPVQTITRSQKAPEVFVVNDSINVFSLPFLFSHDVVTYTTKTHIVEMPRDRSIDIDEEIDVKVAELLLKLGKKG